MSTDGMHAMSTIRLRDRLAVVIGMQGVQFIAARCKTCIERCSKST